MKRIFTGCTAVVITASAFAAPIFFDSFEVQEMTFTAVPLNDTGIVWGGDYPSGSNSDCSGAVVGEQDCSHGRDATENDDSNGHAGFDFTKLDSNGDAVAATVTDHACVRDNVTGLVWEVKTTSGLHNADDTYTWYNDDSNTNGGATGDLGEDTTCKGYVAGDAITYCNTQAYVARVNQHGLCGASDWRLPKIGELRGIANLNTGNPAIDSGYFPQTKSYFYWSSSPYATNVSFAWGVYFYSGYDNYNVKGHSRYVRLVRGGQ